MTRLNIAIQKSGRMHDDSMALLKDCGLRVDSGTDQLKTSASGFPLDILYLRNGDIPEYLQDGVADIAILGENTVVEKGSKVDKVMSLGFSKCRLSMAVPQHSGYEDVRFFEGKRIATSYPNTVKSFLKANGVNAEIHQISGSVEIAPHIGLADGICDLVSSGNTLFQNKLEEKDVILRSEACIYIHPNLSAEKRRLLEQLLFRIKSTLDARKNKYIVLNSPKSALEKIISLLPGIKSPTVLPLADDGWCSVHSVIPEQQFWEVIGALKEAGAQGILVIPIEKMVS
ncbi:MAG: ATP phosphoribosyltransferase [Saprospiraceae bacterium]|nr:ATP phosphoribosyltransferase [Saprospiraceae bacterium]